MPRRDVVAALIEDAQRVFEDVSVQEQLRVVCTLLTSIYHFEFHAQLEAMKRAYAPFNPDLDDERFDVMDTPSEARAEELAARLQSVLERGNYERLTDADVDHAFAERSLFPLNVVVDRSVYREAVLYARGETERRAEVPAWYGLRSREVAVPTFDRVCLYIRFKSHAELDEDDDAGRRQARRARLRFEPGTTILKLFRNIPKADLEILFPNCELKMRASDKLFLGVPAILGGVPVVAKLAPAGFALAVLFGFRRGEIDTTSIIAGLSGLIVLGAYLFRQWDKFKNRRILFNKELSENLYFRNLDNNEGVLTRLVDEAEEEESKEALLAYYFLLRAPEGLGPAQLDAQVEGWIAGRFEAQVDFEVKDALAKLESLGLVARREGRLHATPLASALSLLRTRWDELS